MSGAFLVTSLVVVVLPGTGVLYTPSAGLARGLLRRSFAAAFLGLGARLALAQR